MNHKTFGRTGVFAIVMLLASLFSFMVGPVALAADEPQPLLNLPSDLPDAEPAAWVHNPATNESRKIGTSGVVPSPFFNPSPVGLFPAQIKQAYNFPTANAAGTGQTIAIVDAFDNPTAEADLGVFSTQFGLPACTTANGCFKKVNQTGGTTYPAFNSGWALEIALDIQWAHAIAPGAKILLVEATTNSFTNLLLAENYAKTQARYVSNSWGAGEFSSETTIDSIFSQPGVSFFVSSGDNGAPAEYPSSSPNVISVGGTRLSNIGQPTFSETGWKGSGGGCSRYETATAAQAAFGQFAQVNCAGKRGTPDVSLDADPVSGVAIYVSSTGAGWLQIGGTSASAPMWAARSAVQGALVNSAYVYGNSINYRDITSGNNGLPCLVGYDLVTGRGSWLDLPSGPTPFNYNVLSLGTLDLTSTQVQGQIGAGGNASFQGTNLGTTNAKPNEVFVQGNTAFQSWGNQVKGNVVLSGTHSPSFVTFLSGGFVAANPALPVASLTNYGQLAAQTWAALATNGTTTVQPWGQIILTGSNTTQNVFKVKGSDLFNANSLVVTAPANSTVIINIDGTTDRMQYMGISLNGVDQQHVVFNFYQATSLTVNGVSVPGTIWAPFAAVNFSNGQEHGTLLAKSLTDQNGSYDDLPYKGQLPL